jgi:D-arabinose 1-dehydrogenase-like Zn-dependent alcohol dehydrogenase
MEALGFDTPLHVESFEPPADPGPGKVLVKVEACGVCFRDLIDRSGRFPFVALPVTPGHETVGRIIAVGEGVTAGSWATASARCTATPVAPAWPARRVRPRSAMRRPGSSG